MKMNDRSTIKAPSQYVKLEVCEFKIICPTRDSGIVKLNPTVTTSGDVNNIA